MPPGLDPVLGIIRTSARSRSTAYIERPHQGDGGGTGLGVLGRIVAQAARRSGARVIAIDLHDSADMARGWVRTT